MKKVICLLLTVVLVLGLFAGCQKEADWKEKGTPLADVRVRQALWYAIDFESICSELWDGAVTAAPKSLVPPGEWQPEGLTDYSYNPTKAKELLAEAQWPSDFVIEAVYYTGNLADSITAIQGYWAEVGVKMEFKLLTDNLEAQLWIPPTDKVNGPSEVKWDICFAGTNALMLSEYYTRNASDAPNNSTIPLDAKLDALIAKIEAAVSIEDQKKAYNDYQVYMNEVVYTMPMFYLPNWVITSDKLDMKGNKPGADQFCYEKNILDWTIDRADKTMYSNTGATVNLQSPAVNPGLFWHQELVFDRLINASPSLVPTDGSLAESYTVSADGMTMDFVIRQGVKWHDGKPFTPEDVKWTLEYMATVPGANAIMSTVYKAIESITINGNTVTVKFSTVQPTALTVFSQWPILPKHLLKDVNPATFLQDLFWQNPVGTGSFKIKEVKNNEYTILERNKDYFRTGTGNIEKIFMYPSDDAGDPNLITNIKAGKIDYAFCKDAQQIAQMKDVKGFTVDKIDVTFTRYAFFNMFPRTDKK